MMQTQRTILWVIFVMSLLFLWDSWQKHNGNPSLFGGPPASQQAPGQEASNGQAGTGSAGDASIPSAPASTAAGQAGKPGAVAPASVAASGKLVRIQNDVLQMDVDTMGATPCRR